MNIVIIGFMGVGKTKVGKAIAKRLGRKHIDTDDLIVEKAGKSIKEIFADDGEEEFRKLEHESVLEAADMDDAVISCGGGVVMDERNMLAFKRGGRVYLLQARLETVLRWLKDDGKRPLSKNAEELYRKREPLYEKYADFIIMMDDLEIDEAVDKIQGDAEKWI